MWQVRRIDATDSTNVDVAALARAGEPEGTAVAAGFQRAGRGRLDRTWEAPPGTSLAVSYLLRPAEVPASRWPWLPLLVGVAVVEAISGATGVEADLKWPNDVLVGGEKLAGILVERVDTPTGPAAVAGVGLNVGQSANELPSGAVSLRVALSRLDPGGSAPVSASVDAVLDEVSRRLADRYGEWRASGGDPQAGLADVYRQRCASLGKRVRVELPGGRFTEGLAADVDESGRLVIDTGTSTMTVGAGDIVHLRPPASK